MSHSQDPYPGKLFILVGPPGVGKNTLMREAVANAGVRQLPTATTRDRRANEQEGVEHFFVTEDRFMDMIANDELLEYQQVHRNGRFYGIVRAPLVEALTRGEYLVADIEIKGTEIVRSVFPGNVIAVLISVQHVCVLKDRMEGRSESDAEIARRMLRVPLEMSYMSACPYAIDNTDSARAAAELIRIIEAVRAGRPCQLERPEMPRFRYEVEFRITQGDFELLNTASGEGLVVTFPAPDFPHLSADCVTALIGTPYHPEALVGGAAIESDGFLPPIDLVCRQEEAGDVVRYCYRYIMPTQLPAPHGWEWRSIVKDAQPVSGAPIVSM